MALSIFEDDPLGTSTNDPNTVKRFASKKLKSNQQGQATAQPQDDTQYSQLSSTMPGKPVSAMKDPADPDKQEAIRRRMRKQSVS